MKKSNEVLSAEINALLAKWNPIGVPEIIARGEYSSYVDPILRIGNNRTLLREFLVELVSNTIGLNYDDSNPFQRAYTDKVLEELLSLYSEPSAN